MTSLIPQNTNVYTELSSLKSLKGQVKAGEQGAIEKVAQQFEAIFLQMMLSGMRKTIQVDEEYGNDKSMYYDLFDKQVAMNLSGKGGIGLAKMMMSQSGMQEPIQQPSQLPLNDVSHQWKTQPYIPPIQSNDITKFEHSYDKVAEKKDDSSSNDQLSVEKARNSSSSMPNFKSPVEFIQTVWNVAKDVILESGLSPKAVIAQAALETGWGKHVIKNQTGESSFNLFGIKSGGEWKGDQALANTLEFKDGLMVTAREGFRSYQSIKDSVQDYVNFLKDNQRYKYVLDQANNPENYVVELQKAGYATDPEYANKLLNIMQRKEFGELFNNDDVNGI